MSGKVYQFPCPTCSGPTRETVGMVCQRCGIDYGRDFRDAAIVQAVLGLPSRLKAHRAAHHLSQREVAKRVGVAFSTVSRIESGEDYVVSNLVALAAYLSEAES